MTNTNINTFQYQILRKYIKEIQERISQFRFNVSFFIHDLSISLSLIVNYKYEKIIW